MGAGWCMPITAAPQSRATMYMTPDAPLTTPNPATGTALKPDPPSTAPRTSARMRARMDSAPGHHPRPVRALAISPGRDLAGRACTVMTTTLNSAGRYASANASKRGPSAAASCATTWQACGARAAWLHARLQNMLAGPGDPASQGLQLSVCCKGTRRSACRRWSDASHDSNMSVSCWS